MITAAPRAVGLLIFPYFQLLDAAGLITAFEQLKRLYPGFT